MVLIDLSLSFKTGSSRRDPISSTLYKTFHRVDIFNEYLLKGRKKGGRERGKRYTMR